MTAKIEKAGSSDDGLMMWMQSSCSALKICCSRDRSAFSARFIFSLGEN